MLTLVASPSALRQQLTLLGSPASGFAAPAVHTPWPAVHNFIPLPPKRCERHSHFSPNCRLPAIRSPNACSPAIRPGWRVLRQQLTLLGSPASGFAAPAVHDTSALCSRTKSSPPSAVRGIRLKLTHYRLLLFRLFSFLLELPPPVFWAALLIPLDSFLKRAGSTPGWAEEFNASGTP